MGYLSFAVLARQLGVIREAPHRGDWRRHAPQDHEDVLSVTDVTVVN